jgi:hypothetical protein
MLQAKWFMTLNWDWITREWFMATNVLNIIGQSRLAIN